MPFAPGRRIVNIYAAGGKDAIAHCLCWKSQFPRAELAVIGAFKTGEVEKLVFLDRAADGSAILVKMRLGLSCGTPLIGVRFQGRGWWLLS